jgi:hypothetical protein
MNVTPAQSYFGSLKSATYEQIPLGVHILFDRMHGLVAVRDDITRRDREAVFVRLCLDTCGWFVYLFNEYFIFKQPHKYCESYYFNNNNNSSSSSKMLGVATSVKIYFAIPKVTLHTVRRVPRSTDDPAGRA